MMHCWSMIPDHAQNPKSSFANGSEAAGNCRMEIQGVAKPGEGFQ
jgi:hypothetical protein